MAIHVWNMLIFSKKIFSFTILDPSMKKMVYIILGSICFGLGVIGVFVPLLPTTPFILLTAALYAKSSEKLYNKLLNHHVFGSYIRSFREDCSIPLRIKIVAITSLWIVMLYTIFFVVNEKWYLQIMLGVIAVGVTIHILSFTTKLKKS